jgi:hypothetical protein
MYEFNIDVPGRLVRFSVAGFLDEQEIRRFRADLTSHILRLTSSGKGFKILADLRETATLTQEAARSIALQMRWTADNGVERSASLVSAKLLQLQITRLGPDERFRCFIDEREALNWLHGGEAEPR